MRQNTVAPEQIIGFKRKQGSMHAANLEEQSLHEIIGVTVYSGCGCSNNCFFRLSENCDYTSGDQYSAAIEVIKSCILQYKYMSSQERREYLTGTIKELSVRSNSRRFYSYTINVGELKISVCRNAFMKCHGITDYALKTAKYNALNGLNGFNAFKVDESVSKSTIAELNDMMLKSNVGVLERRDVLNSIKIPYSDASLMMHTWMESHFQLIGDNVPNAAGEIHLEPVLKKDVFSEYQQSVAQPLKYAAFCQMWRDCFSHVKIRPYKNVPGKCLLCLKLTMFRKSRTDEEGRTIATLLHALHMSMYMGERKAYYSRMSSAKLNPENFVGIISDGMAQNHCKLPHLMNMREFGSPLPQHLQGIIDNGKEFVVYRTFHTVRLDANAAIHALLMQLEQRVNPVTRKLPSTVYLQVDGGSENCNKYMLSVCELLVIRRLCLKVVLTRLPVGHTHENIDAMFGVIWTAARSVTVLTPNEYKDMIVKACSKKGLKVRVVDIFVVPDYKAYFENCIDRNFANYSKQDDTQLQFIFEAVERCSKFPFGVKTSHRAYSCDQVVEVREVPTSQFGFVPFNVQVGTHPEGGMCLLTKLPTGVLKAAPFRLNARQTLDKFIDVFEEEYKHTAPQAVLEWKNFQIMSPSDNESHNYPSMWRAPFGRLLFTTAALPATEEDNVRALLQVNNSGTTFNGHPLQQQRTGDSVRRTGHLIREGARIDIPRIP